MAKTKAEQKAKVLSKQLVLRVHKADIEERVKLKKDNRKDNWIFGSLLVFYGVLITFGVLTHSWLSVLTNVTLGAWAIVVFMNNRHINLLRFVIRMQDRVREIENEELLKFIETEETKAKKKETTSARANA